MVKLLTVCNGQFTLENDCPGNDNVNRQHQIGNLDKLVKTYVFRWLSKKLYMQGA